MRNAPEIVEVDSTQLEDVLHRVEQALDAKDAALIPALFQSYVYVADLVEDKNTSIRRLRQLFFGARTEKTAAVVGRQTEKPDATPQRGVAADTALAAGQPDSGASAAVPDVRCPVAQPAGRAADDCGPLPGPCPAAVRRRV